MRSARVVLGFPPWGVVGARLSFTLIVLGLAISTRPMPGQTISFLRHLSTPRTPAWDRVTTVAADPSGIYVIASGGLRKYDSRGNELWAREFSVPAPEGAALVRAAANATGVYMISWTNAESSRFVRKYSAAGDELWTRQLEFLPAGLAVDDTGVYVAGSLVHPASGKFLRKYSAEGAELWTSRLPNPDQLPFFGAVAVDATGVYVLGPSSVGKWDLGGKELWTRPLEIPPFGYLLLAAADPTGLLVVSAGRSPFLRRYDADGNELWTRPIAAGIYPGGVVADATGVYVAGTTDLAGPALPGQCRSSSGVDSFVRKYDTAGAELWTREFSTSDAAWTRGVAVDASGVYVIGWVGTGYDEWSEAGAVPFSGSFLARFEKSAAVVTGSRPRILPDCVVNAASYIGGGVAPGEIVTLFGSALGPAELVRLRLTDDGRAATTLADTRILFNGVPAPLLYVSDKQSSAIVPYAMAGRSTVDIQVEYRGVRSDAVTTPVLPSRPGIFTMDGAGRGQGAILNEDGTINSPSNPAQTGSIITIFGTGGGEAAAGVVDGQLVSGILPRTSLPVSVFFDIEGANIDYGPLIKEGQVLYAGGSPGSVAGLLQLNVRVPASVERIGDAVPFAVIMGSHWTVYQVTVALR